MEFSFEMKVNAPAEKVWSYYADLQKWYIWEQDLEDITLDGEFVTGSCGVMQLAGMPAMKYVLTEVVENQTFCDKTATPLGDIYFNHQILQKSDGVFIRHSVRLDCAEPAPDKLAFLKQVFSDVPDSIMLLKAEAEK